MAAIRERSTLVDQGFNWPRGTYPLYSGAEIAVKISPTFLPERKEQSPPGADIQSELRHLRYSAEAFIHCAGGPCLHELLDNAAQRNEPVASHATKPHGDDRQRPSGANQTPRRGTRRNSGRSRLTFVGFQLLCALSFPHHVLSQSISRGRA
jgi:hypothetical protein